MPLHIENETHWRTPDIRSLVKAAMDAAGVGATRINKVKVIFHTTKVRNKSVGVSAVDYEVKCTKRQITTTLMLPKNGPKEIHDTPMVAIAAVAAAPTDGALLSPKETFWLANQLAFRYVDDPRAKNDVDGDLWITLLDGMSSDTPPDWCDAGKLLICKVKDPLKDGTYRDFVKKKKALLKRAETTIAKAEKDLASAKRRLENAKKRKKEIEASLKSAKERRS